MPWKESSVMEERLCFVARLLDGEPMTDVCRDFGISCKTGYKIFDRYREKLSDRAAPTCRTILVLLTDQPQAESLLPPAFCSP
jgi:transposase